MIYPSLQRNRLRERQCSQLARKRKHSSLRGKLREKSDSGKRKQMEASVSFPPIPQANHGLQDSKALVIGGRVMIVAIIVLFMVIVFVLMLHLYARWIWRRRNRRNSGRHFVFIYNEAEDLQRQGLDPSVIKSIPVVILPSNQFEESLDCAVCLSQLSEGEEARILPKCKHGFHVDCIDMWFHSHSTCPLCRTPVVMVASNDINQNESTARPTESFNCPRDVTVWDDHSRENDGIPSSISIPSESSSPFHKKPEGNKTLMIEIPERSIVENFASSSIRNPDDDFKSPLSSRLKSLTRFLSREKKVPVTSDCSSPKVGDLEIGLTEEMNSSFASHS